MRSTCFLVCYQTTYTIPVTNLPQKSFYGFCKLKIVENHLTYNNENHHEYSIKFWLRFSEDRNNKANVNIRSIDFHLE